MLWELVHDFCTTIVFVWAVWSGSRAILRARDKARAKREALEFWNRWNDGPWG